MGILSASQARLPFPSPRQAAGQEALFESGDRVRVLVRYPLGHYRVPRYIRGKAGQVECVIEPRAVNNEEEGFGRNAGCKRHYYRVGIPMLELWPNYQGSPQDRLKIEIFETWLERI
jgi:nitrile hydratase